MRLLGDGRVARVAVRGSIQVGRGYESSHLGSTRGLQRSLDELPALPRGETANHRLVVPSGAWPVDTAARDAVREAARGISRELGAANWPARIA
jgi:hypothetical protein